MGRIGVALVLAAGCAGLCACGSSPVTTQPLPMDAIVRAETAISRAEDARVADYASQDLRTAQEKLNAARETAQRAADGKNEKEAEQAQWLAEEAIVDVELATAKAQAARYDAANREIERSIDALKQELQRSVGN